MELELDHLLESDQGSAPINQYTDKSIYIDDMEKNGVSVPRTFTLDVLTVGRSMCPRSQYTDLT